MSGSTPLLIAAKHDNLQIVKYLVEKGKCNVNAKDNDQWSSIDLVSKNNYSLIVNYLSRI